MADTENAGPDFAMKYQNIKDFFKFVEATDKEDGSKALTECDSEIQAYLPEKLNWWKNNQSEYLTQNWQHFSSRLHNLKMQKLIVSSLGLI